MFNNCILTYYILRSKTPACQARFLRMKLWLSYTSPSLVSTGNEQLEQLYKEKSLPYNQVVPIRTIHLNDAVYYECERL